MSRIKRFKYLKHISFFLDKLKTLFSEDELEKIGDFDKRFSTGTIHDFKGKEADVVFVVNVCLWAFPLVHPSEPLFKIFGRGVEEVLEEERRLFYVAVTRAKEHLWLLTESDRPSDYLRECFPEKIRQLR